MRALARYLLLCLGFGLLCLPTAEATTLRARTTVQLFNDSSVVATVTVRDVHSEQVGGHIITIAALEVAESFKGTSAGTRLEVVIPGGQVGDWVQRVEGTPSFTAGERCVVYLFPSGTKRFQVSGMELGKLRVEEDTSNPLGGVVRRTFTARMVDVAADGSTRDATLVPTEPLKPYLANLRQLARGAR